jgi:uridine kinase
MKPVLIGVAGGSGSGKTTVSKTILERVGRDPIAYFQHDAYYRDRSAMPLSAREDASHPCPPPSGRGSHAGSWRGSR